MVKLGIVGRLSSYRGEAETGSQPVHLNWSAPGSVRDPISKKIRLKVTEENVLYLSLS